MENNLDLQNKHNDYLSPDIENRILELLKDWEQTNGFIQRDIKLAYLAKALGFNRKYISYVINKNLSKSFPNYINDLRLSFIENMIGEFEPNSKLNLTSLAKLAGFSSYFKFAHYIKKTYDMNPTYYFRRKR